MKKYSANYSQTNHNFVIQNLDDIIVEDEYFAGICIIKNILQRGRPTAISSYLRKELKLTDSTSLTIPFALISNTRSVWIDTIKGDSENNDFPAKTFLYERIKEDLGDWSFIQNLIVPELSFNEITQIEYSNFSGQQVDFFLAQAKLVIEIDGQQHKQDAQRISDGLRDQHLALHNILTVRIDSHDLKNKTKKYYDKIEEIKNRLEKYERFLKFYRETISISFEDIDLDTVSKILIPTSIIRFQILIIELLFNGKLSLNSKSWKIEVLNRDVSNYELLAFNDLMLWFKHIFNLQKISFEPPVLEIINVSKFDKTKNLKIDFSLMQRWTDENLIEQEIIYVRTDYHDLFYNKKINKLEKVNYFKLATAKPFKYSFIQEGDDSDEKNLAFFLENIYGYTEFNPGQLSIIQNALEFRGNGTIGLLPTGGGKSLTYQLACLLQPCISFVVCPIKSLMYDQVKDLSDLKIDHVSSITGDILGEHREHILDNFGNNKYFFVFISPERFQTKDFRDRLDAINRHSNFSYAVIDEVHCLSEWGHDFRTSYLNLSKTIHKFCGGAKFLGLTATASVNVLKDVQLEFDIKQEDVKTLVDYSRPELEFIVLEDESDKYGKLKSILDKEEENYKFKEMDGLSSNQRSALIFTPFVNGQYGCFHVANRLTNDYGVPVKFYSGSKPKDFKSDVDFDKYKINVQDDFKVDKFRILVATKAFGMGINKRNIGLTFHYGIPASMEALYQEAGRAGRDKNNAKCYVILSKEKEDTELEKIFNSEASFEDINSVLDSAGYNKGDVLRQVFLYQGGMAPIEDELKTLCDLHHQYSLPNSQKVVSASQLNSNKSNVEKAIYRLSNLGIIEDWTVDDFFQGIFTVNFKNFDEKSIYNELLSFIRKYTDDFNFDDKEENKKYTGILEEHGKYTFKGLARVLLQWSYDKFGRNRRESLKNVYENCLTYNDTKEGREDFKKTLEAYFKFTQATYILQHIAENNNKDFEKWFDVYYTENHKLISENDLVDLNGNLQRFLESYQMNTGLNLITGLTTLLLNKQMDMEESNRFSRSFEIIKDYPEKDYDYVIDQILELSKFIDDKGKITLSIFLYKFCKSEADVLKFAKELGDTEMVLRYYNERLKNVTKLIADGF